MDPLEYLILSVLYQASCAAGWPSLAILNEIPIEPPPGWLWSYQR